MSNRLGEWITKREEWEEHISRMTQERAVRTVREFSYRYTYF
jgi:hypothetical protein